MSEVDSHQSMVLFHLGQRRMVEFDEFDDLEGLLIVFSASVSRAFDAGALDELAVSMYLSWGCS